MSPRVSFALRALTAIAMVAYTGAPAAMAQDSSDQRAVLVTGTSSGIGRRITEVLSRNGFFVYAGARKPEDLARLDAMENVKAVRLDVTIQHEIDAAVEFVRAEGRGLYGLVNNAGIAEMAPLIEMPEADMQYLLDVNLLGPYRVTKAFADLLIEGEGRVMTVTSIAGILAGPFSGAYSMSKHGAEAYTDALAIELDRFNVAVAAVEPGNYKSQIVASMVRRMQERGYTAEGSRYGSMLDLVSGPLDRSQFEEPDDVALAVLDFLTSDTPRPRYMVVPNQAEAAMTIRQALQEAIQLNEGHEYSYSRDQLVAMLDELLGRPTSGIALGGDLHTAAMEGDLEAVQRHITAGADLNARESMGGSSPLIMAATFGHTDVATALIDAGADLDQPNDEGSTALLAAAFFCHTEIVAALLAAGADKTIPNMAGSTPMDAVSAPFETVKGLYDSIGTALRPLGLELDYEQIAATRPVIAEMLREERP
jgi:NAD(P)-dependent dehydrogenase (short-subunit alcohol dehydrogenase family)